MWWLRFKGLVDLLHGTNTLSPITLSKTILTEYHTNEDWPRHTIFTRLYFSTDFDALLEKQKQFKQKNLCSYLGFLIIKPMSEKIETKFTKVIIMCSTVSLYVFRGNPPNIANGKQIYVTLVFFSFWLWNLNNIILLKQIETSHVL